MKLSDAQSGDVVRNTSNDNFYRYIRPEAERVRIRPLELFPNGLLIPKSMDTIVASTIVVDLVGQWSEGLVVKGVKGRSREAYEREQERCQEQLRILEAEALVIEPKKRGSHANRVKAVRERLAALAAGLEDLGTEPVEIDMHKVTLPPFHLKQLVVMPSGKPARFLGFLPQAGQLLSVVAYDVAGRIEMLQIDPQALRPASSRYMSTV